MPEGHAHPTEASSTARVDWLWQQRAKLADRKGPDPASLTSERFLKILENTKASVLVVNSGSDGELLELLASLGHNARGLEVPQSAIACRQNRPHLTVLPYDLDAVPGAPRDWNGRFQYAYLHRFEESVNDYALLQKVASLLALGGLLFIPVSDSDFGVKWQTTIRWMDTYSIARLCWLAGLDIEHVQLNFGSVFLNGKAPCSPHVIARKPDKPIWGMGPEQLAKGWPVG